VLPFSNWLEPGVSMHLVHMSVSLLIDTLLGLERFPPPCMVRISTLSTSYLILRRVANTGYAHSAGTRL
jgi:hypothetical protein